MAKRKLTRVLFRFDDGTEKEIEDELADEWYRALKARDVFCAVHGNQFPEHLSKAWKPVKKYKTHSCDLPGCVACGNPEDLPGYDDDE